MAAAASIVAAPAAVAIKQPFALEAAALAFVCPKKMGQEKGDNSAMSYTYMLSGIASECGRSPTLPSLGHDLFSLGTLGTEACDAVGGAPRP